MTDKPNAGGSYVKQKDGTLKRVEFTATEAAPEKPADPPAAGDGGAGRKGERR
jgi:hypothetical protein